MLRHIEASTVTAILVLSAAGCARLPERAPMGVQYELAMESLPSADIPAHWGRLVTVTVVTPNEHLWFQNDAGELRRLSLDLSTGQLTSRPIVIRREGGTTP